MNKAKEISDAGVSGKAYTLSLSQIKDRYLSLRDMARDLSRFPEFKSISPSTIFRWLETEAELAKGSGTKKTTRLSPRARKAIRFLSAPAPKDLLRVAYPVAPFSLPLILMEYYLQEKQPQIRLRPLNYKPIIVSTGQEAVRALLGGEADLAISYRYFSRQTEGNTDVSRYARLSSFCRYFVSGLGIKEILSRGDLPTIRFGYHHASGVGVYLANTIPFETFGNYSPKPFRNEAQAAEMLAANTIHYVLGSQLHLSKIRAEMEHRFPEVVLFDFESSLLPAVEFDLFVNTQTPNPLAVFSFLDNLTMLSRDLGKCLTKLPEAQKAPLASKVGFAKFAELEAATSINSGDKLGSPAYEFGTDRFVSLDGILALSRRLLN